MLMLYTLDTHTDESILVSTHSNDPSCSESSPVRSSRSQCSTEAATTSSSIRNELSGSDIESDSSENEDHRSKDEILSDFCDGWLVELNSSHRQSLGVYLCCIFKKHFDMNTRDAEKKAAEVIGKSERSIREWRIGVIINHGDLSKKEYSRKSVLQDNEELTDMAREYVIAQSSVKGRPNMTSYDFCQWVNSSLLSSVTLEPGFPRSASLSTCKRWLHHMGFDIITPKNGIYIDGHERPDVKEAREQYLRRMIKLGFLHFTNAPTLEAAIPTDIEPPTADKREKTIFIFHDETIFHANDDQTFKWGQKGEKIMKKKSQGAGYMISDFIDDQNGFLHYSDD